MANARVPMLVLAMTSLALAATGIPLVSLGSESAPIVRTTLNRWTDLLPAMLRQEQFADAAALCKSRLENAKQGSLEYAQWVSRLAGVRLAEKLSRGTVADEEIESVAEPITALIGAYHDSMLVPFLRFQAIELWRSACFQDCIAASINGTDSMEAQRAVARSAKLIRDSEALIRDVEMQRAVYEKAGGTATLAVASDLEELDQRLHIGVVQTMLAITEVFPPDSDDQRDAATKALRYADASLQSLSSGSRGWMEMQHVRIEAMLRSGNTQGAMDSYEALASSPVDDADRQTRALGLRLELADEQWVGLSTQLHDFFGGDPDAAPRSFEMDLVRLRFLVRLKGLTSDQVSKLVGVPNDLERAINEWIESIGKRNGAYERRRAEAIVLNELKVGGSDTDQTALNPSLIAMQGEEWLRRGDLVRAGELLAAAAIADPDAERSLRHALKSAAVYVAAQDSAKAASILYRTAMKHPNQSTSAAMAVQAAMLLGGTSDRRYHAQVETMIRESIAIWPLVGPVEAARTWLVDVLVEQNRWADIATVSTLNLQSNFDASRMMELVGRWRKASAMTPREELAALSEQFQLAFESEQVETNEFTRLAYLGSAAFALSRDQLRSIDTSNLGEASARSEEIATALALLRFRRSLVVDESLRQPDVTFQADVQRRLMNDALMDPSLRAPVARLIASWPAKEDDSIDHIQRLIWLGKLDDARSAADNWLAKTDERGRSVRELAHAFESGSEVSLRRESVRWWDELSSGLPRGSEPWHQTKLHAAELLASLGDVSEAAKRAKYILLTQPPRDTSIRDRYEALAAREIQ